jgi:hypothetical protein
MNDEKEDAPLELTMISRSAEIGIALSVTEAAARPGTPQKADRRMFCPFGN